MRQLSVVATPESAWKIQESPCTLGDSPHFINLRTSSKILNSPTRNQRTSLSKNNVSVFCGHVTRCHYWKHPFETVGCSLGLYNLKKTKGSEQATVQAFWKTGSQLLSSPVWRANVSIQKKNVKWKIWKHQSLKDRKTTSKECCFPIIPEKSP